MARARILVVDDSATVRRVACRTLRDAGHDVSEAEDGQVGIELAQRVVPDLVLLDAVMPKLDGEGFCRALRSISNLRDVPVVLMSARADKIAHRFMAVTGAVDSIAKPFAPEALLAVAAHALERAKGAPPETEATPEDRVSERAALADQLREVLEDAGVEALSALPDDALVSLAELLGETVRGGESAFMGRLEHIALGEVLQMLQHQVQTGVLRVQDDEGRRVEVCLRDGHVDATVGRLGKVEFLLGRYLVAEGLVDPRDLERLLARRSQRTQETRGDEAFLGTQLIKLGYIAREDLGQALTRQTSELIYEALRWPRGRFEFTRFATLPAGTDAALALPVTAMLMEGLRRVDEWRLIEEQVTSFDLVPSVDRHAMTAEQRERMTPSERAVLDAIDGKRTVRQIIEETRLASFEVCKVLYQLLSTRLVR